MVFLECSKLSTLHPDWYRTSFNDQAHTGEQFGAYSSTPVYLTRVFGWQDAIVITCAELRLIATGAFDMLIPREAGFTAC